MGFSGDIVIKGARQHNLRDLSLRLPRGKFIVFAGVSGSGKTSLVFDTIYAEGCRQYMESLSAASRRALEQMDRPDVDFIQGLSPVIAVEQRTNTGASPRSTLATATEIADYARLLWSLAGEQFCPACGGRIARRSLDDLLTRLRALPEGTRLLLLAPFMTARPAVLRDELEHLRLRGFQRVRVGGAGGEIRSLDERDVLPAGRTASREEVCVEIVVDRLTRSASSDSRLADSLELALREGHGRAVAVVVDATGTSSPLPTEIPLALDLSCEKCGATYEPLTPRCFSHNHPDGACPTCGGLGKTLQFQPELVIPDASLSLRAGAVKPWRLGSKRMISARNALVRQLAAQVPFDLDAPWETLPAAVRELLLRGDPTREFALRPYGKQKPVLGAFAGILADLAETARTTSSDALRARLLAFQTATPCPACHGRRVNPRALAVRLAGAALADFLALPVSRARAFADALAGNPAAVHAEDARRGLAERLGFLERTGLGYLALEREVATLSGGELQRARLATQLGMALVGVTYVLDEPSIGLHPADHRRLLDTLLELRDRGNTLLVVEHDEDTIRAADLLVEIGPGAGKHGGELVFQGTPECAAAGVEEDGERDGEREERSGEQEESALPAALPVLRLATNKQEAAAAAAAFVGKVIRNKNDGKEGIVSHTSLKKMFSAKTVQKSAGNTAHYTAVANVDTLFENAVLAETHPDQRPKGEDTHIRAVHRYINAMILRGQVYGIKITLKEYNDVQTGTKIYSVEAISIAKEEEPVARTGSQRAGHSGQPVEDARTTSLVARSTPIDDLAAKDAQSPPAVNPPTLTETRLSALIRAVRENLSETAKEFPAGAAENSAVLSAKSGLGNSFASLTGKQSDLSDKSDKADISTAAGGALSPRSPLPAPRSQTHSPFPSAPTRSRVGAYLAGRARVEKNARTLTPADTGSRWLTVTGAAANNLRDITARFPVGLLTVVCGVSGSGKSTLVNDILADTAARRINGAKVIPGKNAGVTGLEFFDAFVRVEQDPVGKSARSNPATFTGIFDELRKLYAAAPLAKIRGYDPARFSFNIRGGRCERCAGEGRIPLDMQFLGETTVECPSCHGARYNRETLEVRYRGLNIAETLALTVADAREHFRNHARLRARLATLDDVGLGYLQLGQPASTLSGGESQRLKLSLELAKQRAAGATLYILDEPTTGLHWDDIQRLLDLLLKLRDAGNTLIVIEHHRDIVRAADHLLELGPGGGDAGGSLIFEGTPAELLRRRDTPTGRFL